MSELITEDDVRRAALTGGTLYVAPGDVLSPYAQDAALRLRVKVVREASQARPAGERRSVVLGADHGGFELKEKLRDFLDAAGWLVLDVGTRSKEPVDYPDIAEKVARAVIDGAAPFGILVDGAGIGSAIAANKFAGIRAAKCDSMFDVVNSREHNDANVLTLGARLEERLAKDMVKTWLETPFAGGRHARRVDKIKAMERR